MNTLETNILQLTVSKLLHIDVEEVPLFDQYRRFEKWRKLIYYMKYMGYTFDGMMFNAFQAGGNVDNLIKLKEYKGINGKFLAFGFFAIQKRNDVVLTDHDFNIQSYDSRYINTKEFLNKDKIGYNGITQIILFNDV